MARAAAAAAAAAAAVALGRRRAPGVVTGAVAAAAATTTAVAPWAAARAAAPCAARGFAGGGAEAATQEPAAAGAGAADDEDALKRLVEEEIRLRTPSFAARATGRAAGRPVLDVRTALLRLTGRDDSDEDGTGGRRARFNETVECAIHLAVDPKRSDQIVRGTAFLPHSVGRKETLAVFADDEADIKTALDAGAAYAGAESLVELVKESGSAIPFTRVLATAGGLLHARAIGRLLGPKGLMPNAKDGTVVSDVAPAVAAMLKGQVKFRMDKGAIIHAPLGKVSMPVEVLEANLAALAAALLDAKPAGLKGPAATDAGFFKRFYLGRTMGKSHGVYTSGLLALARGVRGDE